MADTSAGIRRLRRGESAKPQAASSVPTLATTAIDATAARTFRERLTALRDVCRHLPSLADNANSLDALRFAEPRVAANGELVLINSAAGGGRFGGGG